MTTEIKPFDPVAHIQTAEDLVRYLDTVLEYKDPEFLKSSLRRLSETEGMTRLAEKVGMSRQGLYKALSDDGDPKLSTVMKILDSLGLRISLIPVTPEDA